MRLVLTRAQHDALWHHLLQSEDCEEAAFLLATTSDSTLTPIATILVPRDAFTADARYGIDLTDEFRAGIIKQAHDRDAMLIEFHSHPFPMPAAFSGFDIKGLREFVPHVRWRLKGKPYAAVVVAPTTFDAVIWQNDEPEPLSITVEHTTLLPTRRTSWDHGSF